MVKKCVFCVFCVFANFTKKFNSGEVFEILGIFDDFGLFWTYFDLFLRGFLTTWGRIYINYRGLMVQFKGKLRTKGLFWMYLGSNLGDF